MSLSYKVKKEKYGDHPAIAQHDTFTVGREGAIFAEMIHRWGMVAGMDGGEDSAGRHKLRLATETEVVDRATKMTDLAIQVMRERGWAIETPSIEEMEEIVRKQEAEDAQALEKH